jgi:hypothetical protein
MIGFGSIGKDTFRVNERSRGGRRSIICNVGDDLNSFNISYLELRRAFPRSAHRT